MPIYIFNWCGIMESSFCFVFSHKCNENRLQLLFLFSKHSALISSKYLMCCNQARQTAFRYTVILSLLHDLNTKCQAPFSPRKTSDRWMVRCQFDLQKCIFIFSVALAKLEFRKGFSLICLSFSWYYFSILLFLLLSPKPQSHADWVTDQFKQQGFQLLNADQQKCCGLCSTSSVATQLRFRCGDRKNVEIGSWQPTPY